MVLIGLFILACNLLDSLKESGLVTLIPWQKDPDAKDKITSFEERIVQLNAFKEKYGHVRVTKTDDKSLGEFSNNIRRARREPGSGISVSDERIKALDELGFDWGFSSAASDQEVEDEVGRTVDV